MRIGTTGMAIAAYRDTSPAPRHSGLAYGIPDPLNSARHTPRPAERIIEGEVIGRIRWQEMLTTRDYLQLRGLAMSDASDTFDRNRIRARLRADPGKDDASAGILDIYV